MILRLLGPRYVPLVLGLFASLHAVLAAPQIQTAPSALSGTTTLGSAAQVSLNISNPGDAILNYSFPVVDYAWQGSDFQGGPVYAWTDISTTGTVITGLGDETSAGPISIGFNFPFYGQNFNSFQLSSNGFLSFSAAIPSSSWTNLPLPNTSASIPANFFGFFWADLDFTAGGTAHYRLVDANTFVLQFKDVAFWNNTQNKVSCQAILKSDGTIVIQYKRVDLPNCTVGIQNATKDRALQIVYNATYIRPGLAVRISPHNGAPWMVVPQAARSGSVPPGETRQVFIPLGGLGFPPGTYQANLALHSNAGPALQIPVNFTVQLLLSQWKANYFTDEELAIPEISADASDPDEDGLSNAMEFALDSDPFVPGLGNMPDLSRHQTNGQSFLSLSYVHPVNAPEHSWTPEVSSDLFNWVSGAGQTEVLSIVRRGDGSEAITVRDLTPLSSVNRRFMRLKLSMAQSGNGTASLDGILAPKGPAGLTAQVVSGSQIDLSWQDFSSIETGFRIERKSSGGTFGEVASVGSNVSFFQNAGLVGNTTYVYRVRAINAGGPSLYSNEVSATTPLTPPYAPHAYTPTVASSSQINLSSYNYSSGVTGFRIERRRFDSNVFTLVTDTTSAATTYQDTGLQPSTQYFYQIASRNSAGLSGYSNIVNASTQGPPPDAPTELMATAASSYQINLAWVDKSTNETGFRIERSMSSAGPFATVTTLGPGAVAHNDVILAGGVTYFYRVRAINGGGASDFTAASATTHAAIATQAAPFTVRRALGAYQANETIALTPLWQPDGTVKIRDTANTAVPSGYQKIYIINETNFVGELENYGAFPPYMAVNITKVIAKGTEFWRFVNGTNGNQYILPELGGAADISTGRAP